MLFRSRVLDELSFHIAMVYQRFLDPNDSRESTICITVNGTTIDAWDPFCLDEKYTENLADQEVEVER